MEKEQVEQPVQFDEFMTHAAAIFDEVAAGKEVVVKRDGQLVRLSPARRRAKRRARHFSMNDPLWDIVGIGHSSGPTDVSSNKHNYLADAAAELHERDHS